MKFTLKRIGGFLIGPVSIIGTLRIVSGDAHIHVAAPAALLLAWFIIDALRFFNADDSNQP